MFLRMDKLKNNNGLSLLGVLIAVTLLAGSVIFLSRLLISRSDIVESSRQTFVATNISREGLELVRAIRDTNWLQTRDWVSGICTGEAEQIIDARRVREGEILQSSDDKVLYVVDGENVHDNSGDPTPYQRVISIDCAAATASPAFIIVTSKVEWEREEKTREVVLKEKLFNWLPPL